MRPIIESLYIHFPFCRHLCNYCDFYKKKVSVDELESGDDLEKFHTLLDVQKKLLKEFHYKHSVHFAKRLKTLYIGGGTPSMWGEKGAAAALKLVSSLDTALTQETEFTLEVNPGNWTEKGILAWVEAGVNRFSIGLQSWDDRFLKAVDRVHSLQEAKTLLSYIEKLGLPYSVDFMLGLPFSVEWKRDLEFELKEVLSYRPEHLSLYILTVPKHYVHYKHIPDEDYIAEEFLFVGDYLEQHGLKHYEVSNYARLGKESKHNLSYWKGLPTAALGPSATGYIPLSKDEAVRYKWKTQNAGFDIEQLGASELLTERVFLALRLGDLTFLRGMEAQLKRPAEDIIQDWRDLGYLDKSLKRLGNKGMLMADSLSLEIISGLK